MGKTLTCTQYKLSMNIYNCLSPYRAPFPIPVITYVVLMTQNCGYQKNVITHSLVSSKLHTLLQFIGLDPNCYKDHSFRTGAATNTVNMGFSQQYIRKLGRWNSNAIQNILEYPPSTYKRAPWLTTPCCYVVNWQYYAGSNSKGLSKCVRAIGSSSHRGPVIWERKISGSDSGQFHYALISDAQYNGPFS